MARVAFFPILTALGVAVGFSSSAGALAETAPADAVASGAALQSWREYRPALGLKPPQAESLVLGRGSATTQLLARFARTHDMTGPILYSLDRPTTGPGLHSPEQVTGVLWRGGERWSSSLESSTSSDMLSEARRTSLTGLIHAPIVGGAGVSLGLRYSMAQRPGNGGSTDTPFVNGYTLQPGRLDSSASQLAYQLQLNYLYGERNTVALNYSSRREWDQYRLAPDPLGADGWQLSLTGEHWLSPSWALRYDIPTPESSSLIRRQGLRLGLHYRF
jgi:hypothetical protein